MLRAELHEFLTRELAEDGYSGIDVRTAPSRIEIIISAANVQNVLGDRGRRIRELKSLIQKRFDFKNKEVELFVDKITQRGLCAVTQAELICYKLIGGLTVRSACYSVLRFTMESGAKGCEVVVAGKIKGQRAKSIKFVDGLMIHSGDPCNDYVNVATKHVLLRQGNCYKRYYVNIIFVKIINN
jgi:small subunit ribosomal protein S3e